MVSLQPVSWQRSSGSDKVATPRLIRPGADSAALRNRGGDRTAPDGMRCAGHRSTARRREDADPRDALSGCTLAFEEAGFPVALEARPSIVLLSKDPRRAFRAERRSHRKLGAPERAQSVVRRLHEAA